MAKEATKPMTKSAMLAEIAETTSLTRKQVAAVFDALQNIIKKQMSKKGPGVLNVMRLVKVYRKDYPATQAGMKKNPFKPGEMMEVKAKPAHTKIKVRPLRDLKEITG